ncbi:MAG TPA: acyl carrier protein [Longimicrobiales bacterium]|nr:acyl carrier protein [Longimicrobiales bacterium]
MDDVARTVRDYILETRLPGEKPDSLTLSTPLMSGGILDSLATLDLITFLEERYGIEFEARETDVDHLGTLADISRTVNAKLRPSP